MLPIQQDIQILRGVTWNSVLQWLQESQIHKPITAVAIGLPTLVTATAHGITGTNRFPVWITDVQGPRALNTDGYQCADPRWVTVVDADTLAVDFDTGSQNAYVAGGVLSYRPPVDLTDFTAASMQIFGALGDADPLLTLDIGTNGGITLDALGNISRTINAEQSAALGLLNGWYKLELTDADGAVTRMVEGAVSAADAASGSSGFGGAHTGLIISSVQGPPGVRISGASMIQVVATLPPDPDPNVIYITTN